MTELTHEKGVSLERALDLARAKWILVAKELNKTIGTITEPCGLCDYIEENDLECLDCLALHICCEPQEPSALFVQILEGARDLRELVNQMQEYISVIVIEK